MKLVITQHRPVRKLLLAIAVALDYGHWQSIARSMVSTGERGTLLEEVTRMRKENAALDLELKRLRRAEEINRHTRDENHEQLVELQTEIAKLNREIEFYREVVGATAVEPGAKVRGVRVSSLEGDGRYSYRVVLTHVDKNDGIAEGKLEIGFSGDLGGRRATLPFAEVVESGPESLAFKFKHFRMFEGTVRLPSGFVPQQIHASVRPKASPKNVNTATYDWSAVLN